MVYILVAYATLSVAIDKIPIPPTEDEFYMPPEGYQSKQLGAILRHREVNNPGFWP